MSAAESYDLPGRSSRDDPLFSSYRPSTPPSPRSGVNPISSDPLSFAGPSRYNQKPSTPTPTPDPPEPLSTIAALPTNVPPTRPFAVASSTKNPSSFSSYSSGKPSVNEEFEPLPSVAAFPDDPGLGPTSTSSPLQARLIGQRHDLEHTESFRAPQITLQNQTSVFTRPKASHLPASGLSISSQPSGMGPMRSPVRVPTPPPPDILPDPRKVMGLNGPAPREPDKGIGTWLAELFIGAVLCQCCPCFRSDPKY